MCSPHFPLPTTFRESLWLRYREQIFYLKDPSMKEKKTSLNQLPSATQERQLYIISGDERFQYAPFLLKY
jgi:hypothetical protein